VPQEIYLTRVGMTMSEGVVAEWFVPDGGKVQQGELLYRLETEKIDMEVDADHTGTVRHLVDVNVTREPGDVVGWIYEAGESIPDELPEGKKLSPDQMPVVEEGANAAASSAAPATTGGNTGGAATTPAPASDVANRGIGGRLLASPAARRLGRELGVPLEALRGSGPGGRIVEVDVRAAGSVAAPAAPGARVKASPLAKRRAQELGVDLTRVRGSGPGGRITKDDVENASRAPQVAPSGPIAASGPSAGETIPLRGMRKAISERMYQSLQNTAQLTMDMEVSMDDAVKLRTQLLTEWEADGVRPTYTDLVVRAVAKALAMHPRMNSVMGEREITLLESVHVGIAVALDEGLVVPVIRDTLARDVKSISTEAARLAAAARAGTLGMDEMHGGTFTVSTLGMFGVDSFTPILNPPQSGILGVNRIADGIGWDGDRPVRRKTMRLSLTWDHRVLDGEPAARFLATVRDFLEAPYRLLV
jgi:pyruvate dehydrogenase E2 component (dihydrolipoamide acetyltransferase)